MTTLVDAHPDRSNLRLALSPWDSFSGGSGSLRSIPPRPAGDVFDPAVAIKEIAEIVGGHSGADLLPSALAPTIVDVVRHLRTVQRPDIDVDEVRRVFAGYAYHLEEFRFVVDGQATAADFALWQAIIALPVRLGEAGAAEALRGLDSLRSWARSLRAGFPHAVVSVGEQAVADAVRQAEELVADAELRPEHAVQVA